MRILHTISFLLYAIGLGAQPFPATTARLQQYGRCYAPQMLYLHLDRTTYMPEETVWFTAYQLEGADTNQNTLFVSLQHIASDSLRLSARFAMQRGIAGGSLYLPPDLPTGTYRLLAYTNTLLQHPDKALPARFIEITKGAKKSWQLLRQSAGANNDRTITYKLVQPDLASAAGQKLSYRVLRGKDIVVSGKQTTAANGNITIAFNDGLYNGSLRLKATLTAGKETIYFDEEIDRQPLRLNLYPESGVLLEGHDCRVAFELKGLSLPQKTMQGSLLEDGRPIARLDFQSPCSGSFHFKPRYSASYTLRLETQLPYTYSFPAVSTEGYAIHIEKSVVKDSVKIKVYSSRQNNSLYLVIHDFKDIFFGEALQFVNDEAEITLPLTKVSAGIAAITLTDLNENPLAERCIFVQPEPQCRVTISTDNAAYDPAAPVQIKVKITDQDGRPVKGIFSLAATSAAMYDSLRDIDMGAYYYAGHHLPELTHLSSLTTLPERETEQVLLTKFWTRFTWANSLAKEPSRACNAADGISGSITYEDRVPKVPIDYIVSAGQRTEVLHTDSSGKFRLDFNQLYASQGAGIFITPLERKKYGYIQNFRTYTNASELERFHLSMSQRLYAYPAASKPKTFAEEEEETSIVSLGSINRLQEVKITADRLPNPIEVLKSRYNKVGNDIYLGNCGNDYVCMLHMEYCGLPWVNCGEHTGFKPMDGYYYYNPFTRGKYWPKGVVMYIGCPDTSRGKFATVLRATWYNREFYAADASIQAEPEYIPSATLLWRHSVSTDERGEATLHCYTNSIPGSFLVHLQGLSTSGPVSGKAYFRVRNGQ